MKIIIYDSRSQTGRDFVTDYGEMADMVIDVSKDSKEMKAYKLAGNPDVSAYPSVVDTDTKIVSRLPETMYDALYEVQGLSYQSQAAETRRNEVNAVTDTLLSLGFYWCPPSETQGAAIRFPMDLEHQEDYKDLINALNSGDLSYPQTVKGVGNNYKTIEDATDLQSFYSAGLTFKMNTLKKGWAIKDGGTFDGITYTALKDMTVEELRTFIDPRG